MRFTSISDLVSLGINASSKSNFELLLKYWPTCSCCKIMIITFCLNYYFCCIIIMLNSTTIQNPKPIPPLTPDVSKLSKTCQWCHPKYYAAPYVSRSMRWSWKKWHKTLKFKNISNNLSQHQLTVWMPASSLGKEWLQICHLSNSIQWSTFTYLLVYQTWKLLLLMSSYQSPLSLHHQC